MDNINDNQIAFKEKWKEYFPPILKKLKTPRKALIYNMNQAIPPHWKRVSYSTFDNWTRDEGGYHPPDLIPYLLGSVEHEEDIGIICRFLLDQANLIYIHKVNGNKPIKDLHDSMLVLVSNMGQAIKDIQKTLMDGIVEGKEYELCHKDLNKLRRLEAELDEALKQRAKLWIQTGGEGGYKIIRKNSRATQIVASGKQKG